MVTLLFDLLTALKDDASLMPKPKPKPTTLAEAYPHLLARWSETNGKRADSVSAGSHQKADWVCQHGHDDGQVYARNGFEVAFSQEPGYSVSVAGKRQFYTDEEQLVLLEGKNRVWDCGRTQWRKFL